jgi:hypothetical protein
MLDDQPVETTLYSLADTPPAQPERRSGQRYLSLLRVGTMIVDDRRELCLIRNISAGGMTIRGYSAIERGTVLAIELGEGQPVGGKVAWVEDGTFGVTFNEPIDVLALIAPPGDGPRPRMPRIELGCTAWVREGAEVRRTRAVNISQGGMCVQSPAALTSGAEVTVTLLGLASLPGRVKWSEDGRYGIGFHRAVALPDLVGWLQQQQQEQRSRNAAG